MLVDTQTLLASYKLPFIFVSDNTGDIDSFCSGDCRPFTFRLCLSVCRLWRPTAVQNAARFRRT